MVTDPVLEPTYEQLQELICVQHKALLLMGGWYMKAASEADPTEQHEDDPYYRIRRELTATAIRDARSLIEYENRTNKEADERKNADTQHRKLKDIFGWVKKV
jgi:hypothetical protein